jgi:CheY-like chemotaxis protein
VLAGDPTAHWPPCEARDGIEGVTLYQAQPTDLVLCDMQMPKQDGLGTLAALRRCDPGVRFVAISGGSLSSGELLAEAVRHGAKRALQKPIAITRLLDAVNAVLQST